MSIRLGGLMIPGYPQDVRIIAGDADAANSVVAGPAATDGHAGQSILTVTTVDPFGNQVIAGGLFVEVTWRVGTGASVTKTLTDEGTGVYSATIERVVVGTYYFFVSCLFCLIITLIIFIDTL